MNSSVFPMKTFIYILPELMFSLSRDAIEKKKKKRNMKRKMRIPDNTKEREKKHKRRSSMSKLAFYGQGRFLREDEVKGKGREISKIIS
uniref:Uncharacterized protein n=1 Tax=Lactuca sativa TaxID=4236 RepID=A0A9R1VPT8_LACSA|nr:hypothetical protein LSAT_V11C400208380 [Lactuca sativa]